MERIQQQIVNNAVDALTENTIRPVVNHEKIEQTVEKAVRESVPLCLRMVMCPNWTVSEKGRSVAAIPVRAEGNQLIIDNPNTKIAKLLTEEVPAIIDKLVSNGVRTKLLIILADILSPNWVCDIKDVKINLEQNKNAVRLLLLSSPSGKELFNNKEKAQAKVAGQLQLATNTARYEERLNSYQADALVMGTKMNEWYLDTITNLQKMGEYSDVRPDITGRRKIWERALFLAAIYALDGEVIESDLVKTGLVNTKNPPCIALGTVATAHGDIIAKGWNLKRREKIGVTSPFKNSMEHSWSERSV